MEETMNIERGPLDDFEIIWKSGHVDHVQAHQVTWENAVMSLTHNPNLPQRVSFMGEVDGHWRLMLDADCADIMTIRNCTHVNNNI